MPSVRVVLCAAGVQRGLKVGRQGTLNSLSHYEICEIVIRENEGSKYVICRMKVGRSLVSQPFCKYRRVLGRMERLLVKDGEEKASGLIIFIMARQKLELEE